MCTKGVPGRSPLLWIAVATCLVFGLSAGVASAQPNLIQLCHKGKERRRQPGGKKASSYRVGPGRSQRVDVKFAMQDIDPRKSLWLCFGDTVSMNGTPVDLDPVQLRVQ